MNDTYLSASGLCKQFGAKPVLQGLDVNVRPGDIIGLLGANGAGKTTLIEVLLGLSPQNSGKTSLFGTEAVKAPAAAKARIGFVPQNDELIGTLSGRQYLDLIASFYPAWGPQFAASLVTMWQIDLGKTISNYSPGERQKLSIVTALAHRPDLLVLDEPVASFDPVARRHFLQAVIETAADERRAVVFSSHIVSDVERLANIIWILKDGQFLWQGDLDSLKESVIRIHVASGAALPVRNKLRRVVSERATHVSGIRMVALRAPDEDWSSLDTLLGPDVSIEHLNLEEIFLELHS
jgi:ABC-2 type transport system ATP-binding protein